VQPGDFIANRFEIERLAGAGGMGAVYLARDRCLSTPVALKVLHTHGEVEVERFTREAELLAELSHPAIVRFVDHGLTAAGEPYLVTEWLEGENLAERLRRVGLTIGESLLLGARVAEGLGAAHRRGVVHRDIKPSNLLLVGGSAAEVKILDFGIARRGEGDRTLTRTGAMVGTPGYMAPEQARGEKVVDARADVFSLGCVLFKCLTGRRPFEADDLMAILLKLVLEEAPRLRSLREEAPAALDELLARMLAKAPEERPIDGSAVASAIAAIDRHEGGETARESSAPLALTTSERPVMCVVLARISAALPAASESTLAMPDARRRKLGQALEAQGAQLSILADGSLLITVPRAGAFTDQAARAARSALSVRASYPEATIAVVAGRGQVSARLPMGEVIERGVELIRRAPPGAICIDEGMAGLLAADFELSREGAALSLVGESRSAARRTLLGKATPFVGRERELVTLQAIFDEVTGDGVARAVLITAPAGLGKSRLRLELTHTLRERALGEALPVAAGQRRGLASEPPPGRSFGFELWLGRGDPMRAGSPFGLLAPLIRGLAGVRDGEPAELRRSKLRARVAHHLAGNDELRVSVFLGELAGVPFPDELSVELASARRDARLMGDQLHRAFEDFLAAECAAQPTLLVLEDLQWGDRASLQFIDGALQNLRESPLMVLALARPEVATLFPGLWSGRPLTELKLGALSRKASERLARQVLGEGVPAATLDRLVALAGGDAFYLEELIRAVAEGKGDALPETVLAMVQERLDALDAEQRRVLRAASVFGRVFWRGGVSALLGADDRRTPAMDATLADLERRELIQRLPIAKFPGQDEYAFRQSLVREAAYAMLTDADRPLGHRLAGAWLEQAGESDAGLLAEHFERGGEPGRALGCYRAAAAQALEGNDFGAAIEWTGRAIRGRSAEAEADPALRETLGALWLIEAEAQRWRDELGLGAAAAARASALLPEGSDAWFGAQSELSLTTGRLGQRDRLIAVGESLRARWSPAGPPAQRIATARAAALLVYAGAYALADDLLERVQETETGASDPLVKARVHQAVALRALVKGDLDQHLVRIEAAAAHYLEAGDLRSACMAQITLGFARSDLGAHAPAERALREALATAERMGLPGPAAYAKHTLGLVLSRRGALEEARAVEQEAVRSFEANGDARLTGGSRAYLAQILAQLGDLQGAEREAGAAIDGLAGAPAVRAFALATRARILVARARPGEALDDARAAAQLMRELGGIEEGEVLVRLALAEALLAAGERAAAAEAIVEARAKLIERASRLPDPEAQARLLREVPENARTLALAAELDG
jgi:tetratricopeptide (TPR) repeat protein